MKTILQNIKNGDVYIDEVPLPLLRPRTVMVRNHYSLVSAGTEKSVMDFSNANYLQKARIRPDLFRKVLNRVRNEGLLETYKVVRNLLEKPIELGYSCAGISVKVGEEVEDIVVGQRVACAGVFKATHSEYVSVPRNLLVPVPADVPLDEASFVALGAIAMQGIRLSELSLGENVAVYGIGLVGMLVAQMALASGCRVFGLDINPAKVKLMNEFGGTGILVDKETVRNILDLTGGYGVDKVILCAGTDSNEPVEKIPHFMRQKGILSIVGLVSLHIPQRDFLGKEIDIRFSRSYGPGRYDLSYEEGGLDYPYGYVRWTENRNMSAFIGLIRQGRVNVKELISHRLGIGQALQAYEIITGRRKEPYLGILIDYGQETSLRIPEAEVIYPRRESRKAINFGIIGAGTFAQGILLPAFAVQQQVGFYSFCTATGVTASSMAKKYNASQATSDPAVILNRPEINAVIIATRHDTHASYTAQALEAGKAVFVEKPLSMSLEELEHLSAVYHRLGSEKKKPFLMVGYNRRFSPLAQSLKEVFSRIQEPISIIYRVNAGPASNEWINDAVQGGGRIIGEACHFIDFMTFLTGSLPSALSAASLKKEQKAVEDILSATIEFANGSIGSLIYVSSGNPSMPKEVIEVFGGGISAQMQNFRSIKFFGAKAPGRTKYANQVKGFKEEAAAFVRAYLNGHEAPISFAELYLVAKTSLLVKVALTSGTKIPVESPEIPSTV